MAWEFGLLYVDYDGNKSTTRHTVHSSVAAANTGADYTEAQNIADTALGFAQAHSLCDVYLVGPVWRGDDVYLPSSDIDAKNAVQLKVVLNLENKTQKGRISIPGIQETLVRGTDRKVNNATVAALGLVNMYIADQYLTVSDNDVADGVSDADIITKRSLVTE